MMCLVLLGGVWEPIVKWRTHVFTIFTPFFTLGPASTTLYSSHALCHGLISSTTFLQHSTVYSSTAFLQSTTSTTRSTPLCAGVPHRLEARLFLADGLFNLSYGPRDVVLLDGNL